ncbi:hypothetical protein L2U69_01270 [Zavarzinia compransoris]|uniref:hypothetical protein n=1 Tax=Zavarzinia marina TaxID=2911065 RepID=UPI001F2186C6|nr:hypothetical protein [Zavarzinia marina]MCF4164274.1 hypothetical protein [Zavarzinia marina]
MSTMNPEFRRNLWLELTPTRLVIMPLVVGLLLALGWMWGEAEGLSAVGTTAGWVILVLWGTRLAADGVAAEVQGKTWDSQRLSGIGPVAMTVGKLFGATAYAWFGGLMCIVAIFAVGGMASDPLGPLRLLVTALFAQAVALWFTLVQVRLGTGLRRFQVLLAQVVGIIASVQLTPLFEYAKLDIGWYGVDFPGDGFALFFTAVMTFWAWIACWRLLRADFLYRNWPLAFVAFLIFIAVYTEGLAPGTFPRLEWLISGAISYHLMVAAVWIAALIEPKSVVQLRRLLERLRRRDLSGFLSDLPCAVAGLPVVVLAGLFTLSQQPSVVNLGPQLLAVFLFLIRDMLLVQYVVLGPRARRGHTAAVIYLLVLYGLVPALLQAGGAVQLIPAFLPATVINATIGVIGPLIQVGIFAFLLSTRLVALRARA